MQTTEMQSLEPGKYKEILFISVQKELNLATPDDRPCENFCGLSDLNCKKINLCCFKPRFVLGYISNRKLIHSSRRWTTVCLSTMAIPVIFMHDPFRYAKEKSVSNCWQAFCFDPSILSVFLECWYREYDALTCSYLVTISYQDLKSLKA